MSWIVIWSARQYIHVSAWYVGRPAQVSKASESGEIKITIDFENTNQPTLSFICRFDDRTAREVEHLPAAARDVALTYLHENRAPEQIFIPEAVTFSRWKDLKNLRDERSSHA